MKLKLFSGHEVELQEVTLDVIEPLVADPKNFEKHLSGFINAGIVGGFDSKNLSSIDLDLLVIAIRIASYGEDDVIEFFHRWEWEDKGEKKFESIKHSYSLSFADLAIQYPSITFDANGIAATDKGTLFRLCRPNDSVLANMNGFVICDKEGFETKPSMKVHKEVFNFCKGKLGSFNNKFKISYKGMTHEQHLYLMPNFFINLTTGQS